ncbi:MAG: hypothetical protein JWR47_2673 [Phenylobacterium sp.]|jgi:hypothetical protein|uniref:hypothetical protein n=1 Tax=Phenylobacterium sp. TaxID=1871053 RepID=UPI00262B6D7F|nr:hypothetical protein [Phenylobacterium sp.]MDB5436416.1 hypothetical protein [Phenylobacterium sp.]MDB5496497.1 hypothetical protein [Phenylobacterium sp.]
MQRLALIATALVATAVTAAALAACSQRTEPPGDVGVCYHVVPQKNGKLKYFKLVNAPNLETCAANLEAMRLKFLRMGGSQQDLYGAYQANFLFLQQEGVLTSTSLEGPRYVALVRTGDGRLAIPGAMPTQ